VSGVVVVVVVVTERVGAGGGGAETMCDPGSEAQPAKRPMTPQNAKIGVNCLITLMEAERDRKVIIFVLIFGGYTRSHSSAMGCYPTRNFMKSTIDPQVGVMVEKEETGGTSDNEWSIGYRTAG
jgi:hypothetical protein